MRTSTRHCHRPKIEAVNNGKPSRLRPRITSFQLGLSAQAPCRLTTGMFPRTVTSRLLSALLSSGGATRHGALTEKFAYTLSDETAEVFQGEVAGINQVQFSIVDIPSVCLSSVNGEERIVLSPENQHFWLPAAEVFMPAVIQRDVRLIVVKQIELNGGVPRTVQEELVDSVGIRADSVRVSNTVCVLEDGHFFGQEIAHWLLGFGIAIGPERLYWIERGANTFRVGITVLNNNALNSLWMFCSDPIADRRAVILDIDAELLQVQIYK